MTVRIKTITLVLFFVFFSYSCMLWAAELEIPLPATAVKLSGKSFNFGPIKSFNEVYKSSLTQRQVESFYKKEMARLGWKQKQEGVFIKDKNIAVIICASSKNKAGEIEFTVTVSNIPAKEEFMAMRKARPDKLIYMPIYPGSVQLLLLDLPDGGKASAYETESSIEEVAFFYKSGMLNYGWSLADEKQAMVQSGAANCPGCQKSTPDSFGTINPAMSSRVSKVSLIFGKLNGETCKIEMFSDNLAPDSLTVLGKSYNKNIPSLSSKTTVTANYHAYKSIKP